jgi:hypothetical protein
MATITITQSQTYGPADTVTSTNLNVLGRPTAALDAGTIVDADISASANIAGSKLASDALAAAYPVGSIYMNASDSTNPATLLGFGTWVAFGAGKVPVGIDAGDTDFDAAEETGGAKTHTLDLDEMPSHRHGGIQPSGSAGSNSNGFDVDNPNSGDDTQGSQKFTKYAGGLGSTVDGILTSAGATQAHNNLQPYIVVYMWKRTA